MGKIKKGLGYVVAVEHYVCCALLVVMLSICFVAVVMRYAFNSPIVWSEEVILTCLIWFGFMCISIGIYRDDHIAIEGVFNKLPPLARKALTVFRHVLLMVFCMFMTYYGWKIFKINLQKRLPATHWSQGLQYFPMVFSGVLMTVYSIVNLIETLIPYKKEETAG